MGENCQSAYMLIYEKRLKSPLKILVSEPENKSQVISLKEEDMLQFAYKYDLARHYGTLQYDVCQKELETTIFYDVSKNEYFCYKPYFSLSRLIPRNNFLEIFEDNLNFQKQLNVTDDSFVKFFDSAVNSLKFNSREEISQESSYKLSEFFLNFIYTVIGKKDKNMVFT